MPRGAQPNVLQGARRALFRGLPIIMFLALWQSVVAGHLVNPNFLPSFTSTIAALYEMARSGELGFNLAISVYRSFVGLLIGSVIGIALGTAMATSRHADRFFGPIVATTYSLPKSALVPLFILWFGIGDTTSIVTVVLACLLPVVVSTYQGIQSVPKVILWSARAMGTPRTLVVWRILLPAASLPILTGIRIALGFCFVLTLSTEMIAAKSGIGKLLFFYGESGAYAFMFGGLLAIILVAYISDRALLAAIHYLLRWHEAVHEARHHG